MSTGQQHHNEHNVVSFESINTHISGVDLAALTAPSAVQEKPSTQEKPAGQETPPTRAQRLVTSYAAARPILVAVAAIPFIPTAWRAVVTAFVVTLDEVAASFKAGKDLATVGGTPSVEMEPKLPVG
jgi:hypothetical protein